MERTECFEDLIANIEEKYPKYEEEEEEYIDEYEDAFLLKTRHTQEDIQMELNRINPILENKIREEGFGWVFRFIERLKEDLDKFKKKEKVSIEKLNQID